MMKHKITIDENHVYRVDGRVMSGSVTGIIRAAGLMDTSWFTPYSATRGTAVHKAVEYYEQGDLDESRLDPAIVPYLAGWKMFKAETGYQSEQLEQMIFHPIYQFCGTLDQTGAMDGQSCIMDIKTGIYQAWWALQTAAYNSVVKAKRRLSVQLTDQGKYKVTEYKGKTDWQKFLAAMTVAGMRREFGMIKEA
jgi:hypothetical protein